MTSNVSLLPLLAPLLFLTIGLFSIPRGGKRPLFLKFMSSGTALLSIGLSLYASWITYQLGIVQSPLMGKMGLGLSIRLDPLSVVMFTMISLLGYIIIRFSKNYLEGDLRHGAFLGRLCATIGFVQFLVLSNNLVLFVLSWIATSLSLHGLLVFYDDRPGAVVAGFKKFIAARIGDLCLIAAATLLYRKFSTGNFGEIFRAASELSASGFGFTEGAASLLAVAALLKSAQFPTHGWLVEVMETPTPVSALLHAGILNAGPFLAARFAFVMHQSALASGLLILFGGFTALFASTVLLTQSSVKVALGYSSVAHMGFMLLVCGMGVYPAAILHLVAHSFYKAHAFLSSGSVVDEAQADKMSLPPRLGNPWRVLGSLILAVGIYGGFALLWGINPLQDPARLSIGLILVMGLAQIIAPAFDSTGDWSGHVRALLLAVSVATHFFVLETAAHHILHSVVPEHIVPNMVTVALSGLMVTVFGVAVVLQIFGPSLKEGPKWRRLFVHLRKGLYANALFDKLVGAFHTEFIDEKETSKPKYKSEYHEEVI